MRIECRHITADSGACFIIMTKEENWYYIPKDNILMTRDMTWWTVADQLNSLPKEVRSAIIALRMAYS